MTLFVYRGTCSEIIICKKRPSGRSRLNVKEAVGVSWGVSSGNFGGLEAGDEWTMGEPMEYGSSGSVGESTDWLRGSDSVDGFSIAIPITTLVEVGPLL